MVKRSLRYWVMGIAGVLLLVNMLGIFPYYQWQAFRKADARLERDHFLLAGMLDAARLLVNMETGQRGYLITGDPRFLTAFWAVYEIDTDGSEHLPAVTLWAPHMQSKRLPPVLDNIFAEMHRHIVDDDITALHVGRIEQLFNQKTIHTQQELMPALGGDFERSRTILRIGGGQAVMHLLQEEINIFIDALRDRQHKMVFEAGRTASMFGMASALGNFVVGLLLLLSLASLLLSRNRERHMRVQLKRNEEQLRLFIRNMPSAVGAMDRDLRFFLASDRWAQEFDTAWYISPIGLQLGDIFPHYKNRTDWQDAVRRCFEGEVVVCVEDRIAVSDSVNLWARWELHPWYDENGKVGSIIITVENITKRKDMERMKNEFISTVSHELRTPLTSIRGSLGLLEGGVVGDLSEKAHELIRIAYKNCDRLILLINDILDMDKIDSDKIELSAQSHAVQDLIKEVMDVNAGYASEFGVDLRLARQDACAHIFVDAARFQQIMSNLLSNAIKFSPKGQAVEIGFFTEQSQVRIFVRDKGPGIPAMFQTQIFRRFSQADSSDTRARGGTGLGLSIAKALAERMNGWISFESAEGKGTTFWLEFPLYETDGAAPDCRDRAVKILHAEDDPDFFRMIRGGLEGRAHIVNARSVRDALKTMKRCRFDLIVLDMVLPDGSGLAVLEHVRRHEQCPVIVISAFEIPDNVRAFAKNCLLKGSAHEKDMIDAILSALPEKQNA